jgi:4-amino-4-deoxy-L-arabinose transferase-like glycosyltransferase
MLALWAIVRTAPQHYAAVSIVMTVAALVLFTYALTKSQANELRALWFLTGVGTGYILLGKRAGIAYTFASLALVLGTNSIQPHPYTLHALIVFTLATLLCSMCFYIFVSHGPQCKLLIAQVRSLHDHRPKLPQLIGQRLKFCGAWHHSPPFPFGAFVAFSAASALSCCRCSASSCPASRAACSRASAATLRASSRSACACRVSCAAAARAVLWAIERNDLVFL